MDVDAAEQPKVSYGRIVRDEAGNVIDIILDDDEEEPAPAEEGVPGRQALNPEHEYEPEAVEAKTDVVRCESGPVFCSIPQSLSFTFTPPQGLGLHRADDDPVALESMSSTSRPVKRHSSTSEREWLRQLVVKHDDDYEKMARDKSLNVWQKTPGEIKRMVRKAGGVEKLAQ